VTKYQELYQLAKEDFSAEVDRLSRIEAKATALLSVLTLLIGVYGLMAEWALKRVLPPTAWFEWVILVLSGHIVLTLAISWVYVFRVLTVDHRPILSVNKSVIDFYDKNPLVNIYYAMAKRISQGAEQNRVLLRKKAKRLTKGYYGLITSGILVVIMTVMSGSYAWRNPETDEGYQSLEAIVQIPKSSETGGSQMSGNDEKENGNKPSENTQEPDRDLEAPELQYVQESYDPPTEKKKDKDE
jgi:hypothetical protein